MLISLKVKTLDARIHEFNVDDETTIRDFKDMIKEKTDIPQDQQRIIFCGRVLNDEKRLKDFDVRDKVIHVAERPPPSHLQPVSTSSGSVALPSGRFNGRISSRMGARSTSHASSSVVGDEHRRNRAAGGMRNSPLFRALDGMVVGTMTIPFNGNNGRFLRVNPLNASSTFCMNRITVARHMLQCADNIAAYLEDPSRGLNNTSLDILSSGRFTLESTVVEVGISGDIPQAHNLVDMVQGAVAAALTHNNNTAPLLELPRRSLRPVRAVSNSRPGNTPTSAFIQNISNDGGNSSSNNEASLNAIIIDEVSSSNDSNNNSSRSSNTGDNNEGTAARDAAGNNATDERPQSDPPNTTTTTNRGSDNRELPSRRTGTRIFADVIEQMINVQLRLSPFIQQFYELLMNEPTFGNVDNQRRNDAQRIFDRVSEAFHYMSHAQHTISDLMLDLSQPPPRHLTCRPILVEQSGYVNANNMLAPVLSTSLRNPNQLLQTHSSPNSYSSHYRTWPATADSAATSNNGNSNAANARSSQNGRQLNEPRRLRTVSANIDENNVPHLTIAVSADSIPITAATPTAVVIDSADLLQSSAGNEATGTSSSSVRTALSINGATSAAETELEGAKTSTSGGETAESSNNDTTMAATSSCANSTITTMANNVKRVPTHRTRTSTTAALPGFSSDLRSASRQIPQDTASFISPNTGNAGAGVSRANNTCRRGSTSLNNNNNNNRSSLNRNNNYHRQNTEFMFDRFLPCNSHHIHEYETPIAATNRTNMSGNTSNNNDDSSNDDDNNNMENATMVHIVTRTEPNINTQQLVSSAPSVRTSTSANQQHRAGVLRTYANAGVMDAQAEGGDTGRLSHRIQPIQNLLSDIMNSNTRRSPTLIGANLVARNSLNSSTMPLPASVVITNADRERIAAAAATAARLEAYGPTHNTVTSLTTGDITPNLTVEVSNDQRDHRRRVIFDTALATLRTPEQMNPDIEHSSIGNAERTQNFINQLKNFITTCVFDGSQINDVTTPWAIDRTIRWFDTTLIHIPHFEKRGYNARISLANVVRRTLPELINFVKSIESDQRECRRELHRIFMMFRKLLYSVLQLCVTDGKSQMCWKQLMRILSLRLKRKCSGDVMRYLCVYLSPNIPCNEIDIDAQEYVVYTTDNTNNTDNANESPGSVATDTNEELSTIHLSQLQGTCNNGGSDRDDRDDPILPLAEPLDISKVSLKASPPKNLRRPWSATAGSTSQTTNDSGDNLSMDDNDVEMNEEEVSTSQAEPGESSPTVIPGSETWHRHCPSEWLRIISRDVQRQNEDNDSDHSPFSDSYINGMNAKRRKVIQNSKPTTNIAKLISNGISASVQIAADSGAASSSSNRANQVAAKATESISKESVVKDAYVEAVRSYVRDRTENDNSFTPEDYPKISQFIKK